MDDTSISLLQQGTSPTLPPSSSGTKRNNQGKGRDNSPKKKRIRAKCSADGCNMRYGAKKKICSHEGCTSFAQKGGVCYSSHGAPRPAPKTCSHEGCVNQAKKGGVCVRHGAKQKTCSYDGCTTIALVGGVCTRHGAKKKTCSHDGCTNIAKNTGVCVSHDAKQKTCSYERCTNIAMKGGVCVRHGAKKKTCSHDGCTNQAKNGGVCVRHGATQKICSYEGCASIAKKGGVCISHGAKKKTCSHEGCTNIARKGGVCRSHGAKVKICSHDGCNNQVRKSGVCKRHAKSNSKNDNGMIGSLDVSSTKLAASSLDPTPVPAPVPMPMPSLISSNPGEETDDEAVMKMNGNKKEAEVEGEEDTADLATQQAVFAVAVWQNKFEELAKLAKAGRVNDEKISEIRNRFMSTGRNEACNADANDESSGTRTVPV